MGNYITVYPPAHNDTYVKATTKFDTEYWPHYATDPAKSLTGVAKANAWLSVSGTAANQRFHIDLGQPRVVRRIYYENGHGTSAEGGTYTARGAENFTFWGSNTGAGTFDDLVYANNEGWTQLTTSQSTFDRHVSADQADPKYIVVTNNASFRYYAFKFADNYGDITALGVRHIALQIRPGGLFTFHG